MRAEAFRRLVTMDRTGLLEKLLEFLESWKIPFCVIGGQAVNAYVEPLVSLDLDIAVAAEDPRELIAGLKGSFQVAAHPHSIKLELSGSDLRAQIQTDPRYAAFVAAAQRKEVLGRTMPVARLEDVLSGKIWAATDPERRASKRQKDLADIARILESYPHLGPLVPEDVRKKLF
jgi:hypothetical protein